MANFGYNIKNVFVTNKKKVQIYLHLIKKLKFALKCKISFDNFCLRSTYNGHCIKT